VSDFWISSGFHLLDRREDGRLILTEDWLRAYLARPELAPTEDSCAAERALHESLLSDPLQPVTPVGLLRIKDADARENYAVFIAFRDHLRAHETIEEAYLALALAIRNPFPALFIDHLVAVILRSMLDGCGDPFRIRAAECLYRTQRVTIMEGAILAGDEEAVERQATSGSFGDLGRLVQEAGGALVAAELDVMNEDNAALYWERSDRFDMVLDMSFGRQGLDALCRVLEAWLDHILGVSARIQPLQQVRDERWVWHVGLDAEGSAILNDLYRGVEVEEERLARLLSLFRVDFADSSMIRPDLAGRAVYLAMAMDPQGRLRLKPQNLLVNLPLAEAA
jgi:hypothetical protein